MTIVEGAQRSAAWFDARRGIPTCSNFGSILTAVKGTPSAAQEGFIHELIAESVTPPEEAAPDWTSAEMDAGLRLEGRARCAYELEFVQPGHTVKEVGFMLHDSGLFGGSPDALVWAGDKLVGGLELKCPAPKTHVGYVLGGVLPSEYRCQVHGHLINSGAAWWDFFSYAQGFPPFHVRVTPDDFTKKLETELFAFCKRYNAARALFNLPPIGAKTTQTK